MTIYDLKPRFQALLRPLLKKLDLHGITANQVTVTALLLSMILGIVLMLYPYPSFYILLPFFLFFRMALNAIDGLLAREFNQQSRLGAVLNELGDVISDILLYLPFALLPGAVPWLVVAVVFGSVLSEFCGVLAQTLGTQRRYDGPLGKSDRAFLFGSYGLLIAIWPQTCAWSIFVFAIAAMLLVLTCFNRCYHALTILNKKEG